jgi:nucleoside-diphosphate-sugar epimerase
LEPLPLTEHSALRTRLQTYPPEQIKALQKIFGWLDDEYDKIPVEGALLSAERVDGRVGRLPMVYGPGDPLRRVGNVVDQLQSKKEMLLEERLARWRSPRGYVENIAAAIVLLAERESTPHRVYHVAEPDSLSEREWAEEIARVIGWHGRFVELSADQAPDELKLPGNLEQHWVVDSTRIRRDLGYRESVDREEAIRRTV